MVLGEMRFTLTSVSGGEDCSGLIGASETEPGSGIRGDRPPDLFLTSGPTKRFTGNLCVSKVLVYGSRIRVGSRSVCVPTWKGGRCGKHVGAHERGRKRPSGWGRPRRGRTGGCLGSRRVHAVPAGKVP